MRSRSRSPSSGFTVLELNCVIAIIGILSALAAPAYTVHLRRAQSAEALTNVESIAYLQQVHILETGRALACEATPRELPRGERVHFEASACWQDLGVQLPERVRFQYETQTSSAARHFLVSARGDLDGDGLESVYRLDSRTMELSIERAGE